MFDEIIVSTFAWLWLWWLPPVSLVPFFFFLLPAVPLPVAAGQAAHLCRPGRATKETWSARARAWGVKKGANSYFALEQQHELLLRYRVFSGR